MTGAQGSSGWPIPGSVQGKARWSSRKCPSPWQGAGTPWSVRSLLTEIILWFYDYIWGTNLFNRLPPWVPIPMPFHGFSIPMVMIVQLLMEPSSDLSPKPMCFKAFSQGCQRTELLISQFPLSSHAREINSMSYRAAEILPNRRSS